MYQVAFAVEDFPRLVPWLMLNRGELVVLVHPNTDDEYDDHAHHAVWLGAKLPLRLEVLKKPGQA
jgi:DOPA 4,5-dioxygenase